MRPYQKILALALVATILTTSLYFYLKGRNRDKEVHHELLEGLFLEDIVDAILDGSKPLLPNRPFLTSEEILKEQTPLEQLLLSDEIEYTRIFTSPQAEDLILKASTLTELARSKKEITALLEMKDQLRTELERIHFDTEIPLSSEEIPLIRLEKMLHKLEYLISYENIETFLADMSPVKGTWTKPNRILLRWTPSEGWIPQKGYNLFRIVNGKTELIAQELGSSARINQLSGLNLAFSPYVQSLYDSACLSEEKMKVLGVLSEEEFQIKMASGTKPVHQYLRISGEKDFSFQKSQLFSIPGDITEKIPLSDRLDLTSFRMKPEIQVRVTTLQDFRKINFIIPKTNTYELIKPPSAQEILAEEILNARKTIMTKVFVDDQFAQNAGLGYEDDLSEMVLPVNTPVRYIIVPLEGNNEQITSEKLADETSISGAFSITVPYGFEKPIDVPQQFQGYGADNAVFLRWQAPESDYARSIISGYHIERRKKGETEFIRVNETPVAVSYTSDQNEILFETAAFFVDQTVRNGDEYVYKLQAQDIFGRVSKFSEEIEIKVYKVTPPQQPVLSEPALSFLPPLRTPQAFSSLWELNPSVTGVALPIARTSLDTDVYVIYRSKVYGKGTFGIPEELVRIHITPYQSLGKPVVSQNGFNAVFILNLLMDYAAETIYFDNTVEPGYYYKYWTAGIDSWGNESAWSESKIIGYPSVDPPEDPKNPTAMMKHNIGAIIGSSNNPPGFHNRYTYDEERTERMANEFGASQSSNLSPQTIGTAALGIHSGFTSSTGSQANTAAAATVMNRLGHSVSEAIREGSPTLPEKVCAELNNLPMLKDVHELIVLTDNEVQQDGTARFYWEHYQGEGLSRYYVYYAFADNISLEGLRNMSREEIIEALEWQPALNQTITNQCSFNVEKSLHRLHLFMVCLAPEKAPTADNAQNFIPAGWVRLQWERPKDSQVSYFRVYRAEVPYFKENEDLSTLDWNMVADSLKYTVYSEKVDQTYAHYYYYKVTSVSIWGVESPVGAVTRYRIPSTVPPQAPSMLVPFSKKEVNQINFLGVPHASRYEIYRIRLPRLTSAEISTLNQVSPLTLTQMFNTNLFEDVYYARDREPSECLVATEASGARLANLPSTASLHGNIVRPTDSMLTRFKTMQNVDMTTFHNQMANVSMKDKQDILDKILIKHGPLALFSYSSLSREIAETINWQKVGEIRIPPGEDSSGKREYFDNTAQFGETYHYTVQAWNDDNLGSDRPDPVSVFTRKGKPFPPVSHVKWENVNGKARISWHPAKDPNLSVEESREYIVGYLVFKSTGKNGDYYQASGLIDYKETSFLDMDSDLTAHNWYRIKVVDTAGYLSEFSEPLLATLNPGLNVPDVHFFKGIEIPDTGASLQLKDIGYSEAVIASADPLAGMGPSAFRFILTPTPTPEPTAAPILIITPKPLPTGGLKLSPTPTPIPRYSPTPEPTPILRVSPIPLPTGGLKLSPTPTPAPRYSPTPEPTPILRVSPIPLPTGGLKISPTPTPRPAITPDVPHIISPTPPATLQLVISDIMKINGFTVSGITLAGKTGGTGEGMLHIRKYAIPVQITIDQFKDQTITSGKATLKTPSTLAGTGIYFSNLNIDTTFSDAYVTGYVKNENGGHLMGSLFTLDFLRCRLTPSGIIHIESAPSFHYQNLFFSNTSKITVNFGNLDSKFPQMPQLNGPLDAVYGTAYITLHQGVAENNLGLESTNNKGIEYEYTAISFNQKGELSGNMALKGTQTMSLVIPAGLGIKALSSTLEFTNGKVDTAKSHISGRVLTCFETFYDQPPTINLDENYPVKNSIHTETIKKIISSGSSLNSSEIGLIHNALYHVTVQAQSDAMQILPSDPASREKLSYVPFTVKNWDGYGFIVQDTTMTPSNIPLYDNRKLNEQQKAEQKDANLGITPTRVALDLCRKSVYSEEAPQDTKTPGWMGIVVKGGSISLPPAYIQTNNNQRIRYFLSAGQLLYDQNGFCYQNQAYSPEGIPAKFGSKLGDFDDVLVRNVVMDLYNNIVDLEIEADLAVPIFHRRIRVKMVMDDDSGEFVCNVAETDKFDPGGDGKVMIKILSGFLDEVGMHLDGTMDLVFGENGESLHLTDAQFNNMIIPSKLRSTVGGNFQYLHTQAVFDKPYKVYFHHFPMDLRSLDMYCVKTPAKVTNNDYEGFLYNSTLKMQGGMQLSDKMAMNTSRDPDIIQINNLFHQPEIALEKCRSEVILSFEEFAEVKGVGVPIKTDGDYVEYDTSKFQMMFNAANSLVMDDAFKINARIGYDKKMSRSYFAVALYYTGPGIPFGFGEICDMGAMLGYNMNMKKNDDGTYFIPEKETALLSMVDTMSPLEGSSGNYFFAATCKMKIGYQKISLGELRNIYLIVEKGPTVEMGGDYYGPDSIDDLSGTGTLAKMGIARVGYYHRQKLFKFSISLYDFPMCGFSLSGDLGFEMSPKHWELRVGYPDMIMARSYPFEAGFGIAIRSSKIDESYIKAKAHLGFDTGRVTIAIVYLRAFLYVGGEGIYRIDSENLWLSVYLRGGVEGGVHAAGSYFNVISLMLEANGDLVLAAGSKWSLKADARISYHVDLWLTNVKGSVNWHINVAI